MQPRVYQFGPVFKTLLVLGSLALVAMGAAGAAQSYLYAHGVLAQFGGILLSLIPIAVALFGAPMLWRCKLTLHEDRLEYNGLMIDATIRKADVIDALSADSHYGVFSIFLTLAERPFKKLHIAVLGHMDDALSGWVKALPHSEAAEV